MRFFEDDGDPVVGPAVFPVAVRDGAVEPHVGVEADVFEPP
jgi:hypothetical protein